MPATLRADKLPTGCRRRLAYCSLAGVCYTGSAGARLNAQDTDSTCVRLCEALLSWLLVESLKFVTFFLSSSSLPSSLVWRPCVYTGRSHLHVQVTFSRGGLSISERRCASKAILLATTSQWWYSPGKPLYHSSLSSFLPSHTPAAGSAETRLNTTSCLGPVTQYSASAAHFTGPDLQHCNVSYRAKPHLWHKSACG